MKDIFALARNGEWGVEREWKFKKKNRIFWMEVGKQTANILLTNNNIML